MYFIISQYGVLKMNSFWDFILEWLHPSNCCLIRDDWMTICIRNQNYQRMGKKNRQSVMHRCLVYSDLQKKMDIHQGQEVFCALTGCLCTHLFPVCKTPRLYRDFTDKITGELVLFIIYRPSLLKLYVILCR